jgi:hypothetical protein
MERERERRIVLERRRRKRGVQNRGKIGKENEVGSKC